MAIVVTIFVIALDMLTKGLVLAKMTEGAPVIELIPGFFSLQFVLNPGASFGMLANQRILLIIVSLATIGGMLYFLRQPEAKKGIMPWAMGLLLGGAVGNLIDRIRFGKVVDFLLFYWREYQFPNFNVADMAISVGVGLFILQMLMTGEERREAI